MWECPGSVDFVHRWQRLQFDCTERLLQSKLSTSSTLYVNINKTIEKLEKTIVFMSLRLPYIITSLKNICSKAFKSHNFRKPSTKGFKKVELLDYFLIRQDLLLLRTSTDIGRLVINTDILIRECCEVVFLRKLTITKYNLTQTQQQVFDDIGQAR